MASGDGSGSALNRLLRKSGNITPRLRRRNPVAPDPSTGQSSDPSETTAAESADELLGATGGQEQPEFPMNALCAGSKLSASSEDLGPNSGKAAAKRKSKTLTLRRKKSEPPKEIAKKPAGGAFWTFRLKKRFPVRLRKGRDHGLPDAAPVSCVPDPASCVCTGYRRTDDHVLGPGLVFAAQAAARVCGATASPLQPNSSRSTRLALGAGPGPTGMRRCNPQLLQLVPAPSQPPIPTVPASATSGFGSNTLIDFARFNPDEYPTEDVDELLIAQRARDMELGIEISPSHVAYPHLHYSNSPPSSSGSSSSGSSNTLAEQMMSLSTSLQSQCVVTTTTYPAGEGAAATTSSSMLSFGSDSTTQYGEFGALVPAPGSFIPRTVHTQVDYIHCLVPDLLQITSCSFYWGVMDRYEAERLLENRPEGTFLLRDSAQEEFLFSVSFRRYGRSLHARIEQWNHKFSFDSHDPGVFASETVCGLIEHYKDPSCCMFFEPMLTIPLNRTFPFSLQHLCRAVICSTGTYDGINFLPLPTSLREYLKYYHYKQKVRVRRFEMHR